MLEKILKQYGVDKVSAKTKIAKKNLVKLRDRDFEGFSKPQAFGFLSILQREYGDECTELKTALEVWFTEQKGGEKKEEIFISADERKSEPKYRGAIAVIILLLLAAAALYFFRAGEKPESGVKKAAETHTPLPAAQNEANESVSAAASAHEESLEAAKPKVEEAAAPEKVEAVPEKEQSEPKPYVPMENPVITPVVKLWFGIIDLESKKRVAKTTADPYEIESKGKRLLITGHGRFEISDSFGNLFKYNDAKKHYFLIDDGMVKEIPLSEFRRLNGGKVW
ncbi:membrane protein [Hydrogenimonas sp.]|nr:membrane protein [Hydrogenimonas sp.]